MYFMSFLFIYRTNIDELANEIISKDTLLSQQDNLKHELQKSLNKLQKKLQEPIKSNFYHFKTLKANILPITNVAFDREGNR